MTITAAAASPDMPRRGDTWRRGHTRCVCSVERIHDVTWVRYTTGGGRLTWATLQDWERWTRKAMLVRRAEG